MTMRATLAMNQHCTRCTFWGCNAWLSEGYFSECGNWPFYLSLVVWVAASVATLWWLNAVFSRYETTLALPIEYGTVFLVTT